MSFSDFMAMHREVMAEDQILAGGDRTRPVQKLNRWLPG
jgi:hypothetical protein